MDAVGVLDVRDHVLRLAARVAELGDGHRCIREQPPLVVGIDPRARDDSRSIVRADFRLDRLDDRVEGRRIHESFLDEQRLERLDAQRQVRWRRLMVVLVRVLRMSLRRDPAAHRSWRYAGNLDGPREIPRKSACSDSARLGVDPHPRYAPWS